jgi:hypothetical protein
MKMQSMLILVLVAVQTTASAQELPRPTPAPNGAVTAAGEAYRELRSATEALEATSQALDKSLARAVSVEHLGVQEAERIRLLAAHLDALVETIDAVLADQEKVRLAFQRLAAAAKDVPPKLRLAEARYRELATTTTYLNVKDFYLAAADWYHARAERIEKSTGATTPRPPDAAIDELRNVARSLRELQTAVKEDPLFFKNIDPAFQDKLFALFH